MPRKRMAGRSDHAAAHPRRRVASEHHSTTALTRSAVGEFLQSLASISAAASLFSVAPRIDLGRLDHITFPRRANPIDANAVSWVDEGAPARVPQLNIAGGAKLGPDEKACRHRRRNARIGRKRPTRKARSICCCAKSRDSSSTWACSPPSPAHRRGPPACSTASRR